MADWRTDWARRQLERLQPLDGRGRSSVRAALVHLDRLARPFDRDAAATHVTASAIVAGRRGTVLLLHKRLGIWVQPGGHIDPGEAPWDAAERETREETGLAVRPAHPDHRLVHVDIHPAGEHVHIDLRFLLLAGDRDPAPPPGESQQVRWFSWSDAAQIADPGLGSAIAVARRAVPRSSPAHTEDG